MRADDDLISEADALMRRHRSFVARPVSPPPEPAPPAEDEAIPLLTEVVPGSAIPPQDPAALLAPLQGELESAFSAWLGAALPAALADTTPQIFAALTAEAHRTLLPQLLETLKNGITRQKL